MSNEQCNIEKLFVEHGCDAYTKNPFKKKTTGYGGALLIWAGGEIKAGVSAGRVTVTCSFLAELRVSGTSANTVYSALV